MTAYRKPPALVTRVLKPMMALAVGRLGLGGAGRVLETGAARSANGAVPVNLLVMESERHLVSSCGETQWVRNLRTAGEGKSKSGKQVEEFTAAEMPDDEKPSILREYLAHWARDDGIVRRKARRHGRRVARDLAGSPVFRLQFERS